MRKTEGERIREGEKTRRREEKVKDSLKVSLKISLKG